MRRKASHPGNFPTLYEVFEVDAVTNSFIQVTEPGTQEHISMLFDAVLNDPETRDRRYVMVTVTRECIVANFDTNLLEKPQPGQTVQ